MNNDQSTPDTLEAAGTAADAGLEKTANPFDQDKAQPPVAGPISSALPLLNNMATGSIFMAIGANGNMKVSVRFWYEGHRVGHPVHFRLRVEGDSATFEEEFRAVCPNQEPWTIKSRHASLIGSVDTPANDIAMAVCQLELTNAGARLFGALNEVLPGTKWALTEPEFQAFFMEQAVWLLSQVPSCGLVVVTVGSLRLDLWGTTALPPIENVDVADHEGASA